MNIIGNKNYTIQLTTLLLSLCLIFNHNGSLWGNQENEYIQLFLILIFSLILLLINLKNKIKLSKVDIITISTLFFVSISRTFQLGSFDDIHIITTYALILYFLLLKTIKNTNYYYHYLIIITFFLSLYCFLEFFHIVEPTSIYWSISGNFSNPGPLGGFVAIVFLITICQLIQKIKEHNLIYFSFYVFAIIVFGIVVFLSKSRAGLLAIALGLMLLIKHYRFYKWKYFQFIASTFCLIICILFLEKGFNSLNGRFLIWKISFQHFHESPITGIGYNFFEVFYPKFQADHFSVNRISEETLLASANTHAFNEFIKFIVEHGLMGLIFIIISILWILKLNKKKRMKLKDENITSIVFFISFLVFSCFSYPLEFMPFKLILLNQIAFQENKNVLLIIKKNNNSKIYFIILFCGLIFQCIYKYKGVLAWKNGYELQYSNPNYSKKLYQFAKNRLENNGKFLFYYGVFQEKKDPNMSLNLYNKSKKLYFTPSTYIRLAKLQEKQRDYDLAEYNYLKYHYVQPHLFKPLEELLDFYIRTNNIEKEQFYINKIIEKPIKVESLEVSQIKEKAKKLNNKL